MGKGGHGAPSASDGPYSPFRCFANIFVAFVGAGVLGMPYAFSMAGVLEGCVILGFAAAVCTKAMLMILDCKNLMESQGVTKATSPDSPSRLSKKDDPESIEMVQFGGSEPLLPEDESDGARVILGGLDYGDVANEAAGEKGWWISQASIVMSQVGFCCAYLIFIMHNLSSLVPSLTPNEVLSLLLIPEVLLVNIRDMSRLGPFSIIANASNIFAYCVVFAFDYAKVKETHLHGRLEKMDGFPFFLGVAIYCYEGAGMIIALESSVPKAHRKEFPRILVSAITLITSVYMFFGASGYISYGNETEKIITLNLPPGPFPSIVKACLCFSLFFTYPVMMFPVSALLDKVLGCVSDPTKPFDPTSKEFFRGTLMRAGLVGVSGIVVTLIPDFAAIMGLIGSTCCMLLALILPAYFHLCIFGSRLTKAEKCFDYFVIGLGLAGSVLGLQDALERIMSNSPDSADGI